MMIYGPSGSGKTWLGLAAKSVLEGQRVVYLGNEQGAVHYAEIPELEGFDCLETRDLSLVERAVGELERGGCEYGVFVLDTITDLYKSRQRKYERPNKHTGKPEITMRDWGPIKREHDDLVRRIINLPMHIVVISQEKPVYDKRDGNMVQVGVSTDSDKKDPYMFDVIIRLYMNHGKRCAYVEKDRTRKTQTGQTIESPAFSTWATGNAVAETVTVDKDLDFDVILSELRKRGKDADRTAYFERHKAYINSLAKDQVEALRSVFKEFSDARAKLKEACGAFKTGFGEGFFAPLMAAIEKATDKKVDADCEKAEADGDWVKPWNALVSTLNLEQLDKATQAIERAAHFTKEEEPAEAIA